jgi:hypothetical protein
MYHQLLGWMHRKLRQNNNDVFKEFTASGGTSINLVYGSSSLHFCVKKVQFDKKATLHLAKQPIGE